MMIVGEILNFAAYSFVEGLFAPLSAPVTGSSGVLHSHRSGEYSMTQIICFIS